MPSSRIPTSRIIVGIDPGSAITGYAFLESDGTTLTVLEYGVLRTYPTDSTAKRLHVLYTDLLTLLNQYSPSVAGIEQLFFARNTTSAMTVAQARGVLLLALEEHHLPIEELTPPQVKQAVTGHGAAEKKQVQYMTKQILKLKTLPTQDDAADALAIAIATDQITNRYQ